ncbi:MAG: hypothetical protein EP329_10755 [Deltaproteobacteria bacterium]|nr:MAG: hypothetical protein EP329_10755 [Deltaproteobacteria bacterium]
MLERLRRLLRPDRRRDEASTTYRLCRLRHATLHPGASLWTPGVGGGNLGVGAAEALDDVGIGGELVVGFQVRAREPVHPHAVLARIEEVRPFPPDWDPEGLGASQRYLLVGVARVTLDRDTITHKRIPTVTAQVEPPRDEELEAPSPELLAQLTTLAAADNHWPQHWHDAFELLRSAPLGQWATTLGWRLSADERIALFDHPERIGPAVASNLESLQVGLDPARRREAVRVQALTRRTTVMPDRTMRVVADAEGWALFHPADIGPDLEGAVIPADIQAHLALGDLVSVHVPAGTSVRVRLTGGELNEDEVAVGAPSVTFRLDVRHGRLFLGGGTLANNNHFQDKVEYAEPAQWVDVPNGLFATTVTALKPGEDGERGYVVQLREVIDLAAIPAPAKIPEL